VGTRGSVSRRVGDVIENLFFLGVMTLSNIIDE
jgi:hypothetical protein